MNASADVPESVRDKRRFPRVAVSVPARLLRTGAGPMPCTVVDISSGGARVKLGRGEGLPEEVVLVDLAAGLAWEARIAWRKDGDAGLRFARRHDLKGFVPANLLPAKTVWLRDREQAPAPLQVPQNPARPAPRPTAPVAPPPEASATRKAASALVNSWRGKMTLDN